MQTLDVFICYFQPENTIKNMPFMPDANAGILGEYINSCTKPNSRGKISSGHHEEQSGLAIKTPPKNPPKKPH
jgi:hypothetical protein